MEQKKKALGRGLEQLFSSEVLDFDSFEDRIMESATESDIKEIPVAEIRPNPYQPRKTFDQDGLMMPDSVSLEYQVLADLIDSPDMIASVRSSMTREIFSTPGSQKAWAILNEMMDVP